MPDDLNFQKLSTVQSDKVIGPPTIASAASISPTTKLTFVTGTIALATIVPPTTGYHEITLIFTNAAPAVMLTSGNIQRAVPPAQNVPVTLYYDPATAKYWGGPIS